MSYRRNRRGLPGLLAVAVLGLMGFSGSAQALTPLFNVNGLTNLHATISGQQEGIGELYVPGSKTDLLIRCSEFEVIEGLLLAGGLVAHTKLLYKECKPFLFIPLVGEEELTLCHVSDVAGGDETKLHITAAALLLPIEFADGKYGILAEKIVATVNFLAGKGCELPLKTVLKGEVCFKITANNDTTEPLIQSSPTIQSECPEVKLEGTGEVKKDKLLFGTKEAFIQGSAKLLGFGAHQGKTLGVLLL